jgi:hypothetical protein
VGIKTPFDIIELAGEIDKSIGLRLEQELENFRLKLSTPRLLASGKRGGVIRSGGEFRGRVCHPGASLSLMMHYQVLARR